MYSKLWTPKRNTFLTEEQNTPQNRKKLVKSTKLNDIEKAKT